jgi:hypothetical protein
MRRRELALLVLLLGAAASPARAQGPTAEDRSQWQYVAGLRAPQGTPAPFGELIVPPEVFGKARPDLADLRLFDDAGKEVPYALQIRRSGRGTAAETHHANLSERQAVPTGAGQPGSMWYLTFNDATPPIEDLSFVLYGDQPFQRPYVLEAERSDGSWEEVTRGEWRRLPGEKRSDDPAAGTQLRITLPREVQTRRLRLTVVDRRNPPLELSGATYSAAARVLVFANDPGLKEPLRLYFGNPNAQQPGYEVVVPADQTVAAAQLGPVRDNPEYRSTPKPWTERWPGLIYLALTLTSLALFAFLVLIARQALTARPVHPSGENC